MGNWEITIDELQRRLGEPKPPVLLDVREPHEVAICALDGALHIPMREVPLRTGELPDPETYIVVYCHHGMRSMSVVIWLREAGWPNAISLRGGIDLWAARIDPKMARY
jgi:rhodanese-related sulfurtransferase